MLRRHAIAAITLGGITGLAACRDSLSAAPTDLPQLDLDCSANDGVASVDLEDHFVFGGGGCRIHVIETGDRSGQPILFIHGFSQSALTWLPQLTSDLAHRYHLVAMDLRGHGASDRPGGGYDSSELWAADVHGVIQELSLEQPILCGWSYGPLVMLDYVRYHGEAEIGGLHVVDGLTKLGSPAASDVLTPELLALVPGFFSTDAETSVNALQSLLRLAYLHAPSAADLYTLLGFNVSVPPFVRHAMFSRTIDNDDLLPRIRKPLLITHGASDAVVKLDVVEQMRRLVSQAEIQVIPNAGHAPFADDAPTFNRRLAAFADTVRRR